MHVGGADSWQQGVVTDTWMDRLPQGPVFSIIINIYTKMRHLLARKSQISQKLSGTKQKTWGGATAVSYEGGQPGRVNGPFWLQRQRKYCDLIKQRKPTQAKAYL